jgi:predicted component of type VI protein secretion system
MYDYGIGGQEVPKDASEAIADIPQNRTLMIEKLTADAPVKPEVVEGLKTVEEVFQHFKPQVECEFQNENGSSVKETLSFSNLGDFGTKGITNQSNLLQELQLEKNEYAKLVKQLKSNKLMKSVIENADSKQAFIDALQSLIQEIEDAK